VRLWTAGRDRTIHDISAEEQYLGGTRIELDWERERDVHVDRVTGFEKDQQLHMAPAVT
jgi:hypothetical protein